MSHWNVVSFFFFLFIIYFRPILVIILTFLLKWESVQIKNFDANWTSLLQVIEPNIGNGGETIAILAIKVSVQSVFSRLRLDSYYHVTYVMC